jgi:hypothetical protein
MAEEKRPFGGTRAAWEEVGERFTEVGRLVREQYQQLGSEAKEAGTEATDAADEARRTPGDAIQEAIRRLDQALTSVGDTIRDPDSKQKLKEAGRSLGDALRATFTEAGDEARRRFGSKGSEEE